MRYIKLWVNLNERILKFTYPSKGEQFSFSIFLKKVFVDYFLVFLIMAIVSYIAFDPTSSFAQMLFYVGLNCLTIFTAITVEAVQVLITKIQNRKERRW